MAIVKAVAMLGLLLVVFLKECMKIGFVVAS